MTVYEKEARKRASTRSSGSCQPRKRLTPCAAIGTETIETGFFLEDPVILARDFMTWLHRRGTD